MRLLTTLIAAAMSLAALAHGVKSPCATNIDAAREAKLDAQVNIPRPEYPRPQFERTDWVNLNGTWTYELDLSNTGINRKFDKSEGYDNKITVPPSDHADISLQIQKSLRLVWAQACS